MADKTKIEWSDATWNVITGCSPVSPGCANCYAAQLAGTRLKNHPSRAGLTKEVNGRPVWTGDVRFNEEWLTLPLRWKKPRRIFVCAHSDIFHSNVPDEWLDKIFAVMVLASQHTFQVLTKRPERMRAYIHAIMDGQRQLASSATTIKSGLAGMAVASVLKKGIIHNVWLGVTAENQEQANKRIPLLMGTPAAKRFVSIEPMLSHVDLEAVVFRHSKGFWGDALSWSHLPYSRREELKNGAVYPAIDWVICGGESGPNARPMHPDWVRSLRDQCQEANVPFFFKQWGNWCPQSIGHSGEIGAWNNGAFYRNCADIKNNENNMNRVSGKKYAGYNLLDGKEYLEVPV